MNEPVLGASINDFDGNVYHTVTIGTQTWMIENLKTTHYNDSTIIPLVIDSAAWTNLLTPGYCWYKNDTTYKNTYGALYNWYTVNTGKLAPKGWHIPTDYEWTILENNVSEYFNNAGSLAKILASNTNWRKSLNPGAVGNNLKKNNSSEFSALPGGLRLNLKSTFNKIDSIGVWWSSTQTDTIKTVLCFSLRNDLSTVERGAFLKNYGFSVRCIKDSN